MNERLSTDQLQFEWLTDVDLLKAIEALNLTVQVRLDNALECASGQLDLLAGTFTLTTPASPKSSERIGIASLYCAASMPASCGLARAFWDAGRLELSVLPGAQVEVVRHQVQSQATALLLPEQRLRSRFQALLLEYDIKWRGHGALFVDGQGVNIESAEKVITQMSADFGYPASIVRSRLVALGWLRDVRPVVPGRRRLDELLRGWAQRASAAKPEVPPELKEKPLQD